MDMPGAFPNCLETSKAFQLKGFETVNDKVLREMNERAKSIVEPTAGPGVGAGAGAGKSKGLAATAAAAATASRTPKRSSHHKRYSSVHRRQFAKMESIAAHPSVQRKDRDERQVNETELNNDTKKETDKRTSSRVVTNASKRRRMDFAGRKIELRSSTSRSNLAQLVAKEKEMKTVPRIDEELSGERRQQAVCKTGTTTPNKPQPLSKPMFSPAKSPLKQQPLSPSRKVENLLNRLPPPPKVKPAKPTGLRKSPSVANLDTNTKSRIPRMASKSNIASYALPTKSSVSRLAKTRSVAKSSPNLKALRSREGR